MADAEQPDYTTLTVQLLSAYVTNNLVPSTELAALIQSTRAALVSDMAAKDGDPAPQHVPAVSVRKSLASRDHLISLIDGRPYKTLKRHLASHGLTPAQYREQYGLPASYPMVAPTYSEHRRAVAQKLGLGRRGMTAKATAKAGSGAAAEVEKPTARRKTAGKTVISPATDTDIATRSAPAPAPAKTARTAKQVGPTARLAEQPTRKAAATGNTPDTATGMNKASPSTKAKTPRPAKAAKASRKMLGIKAPEAKPSDA